LRFEGPFDIFVKILLIDEFGFVRGVVVFFIGVVVKFVFVTASANEFNGNNIGSDAGISITYGDGVVLS
jgi:hypothetical protein